MSDNVVLNSGTGGDTVAADDVAGVKFQVVKIDVGGDGASLPVSNTNPVPVSDAGGSLTVDGTFWQATQPVSGTFWQATQPVSGTFWQATQPVSGTVSITANSAVNVAQVNGVTTLMGNGVTGTGSQRVTIASDNTAFSVNAVQSGTWNVGTVTAVTAISNALPAGTNNIGDVDVLTVPADPFGANADAASATGSISAKLRFIAATGIPITGTVTVGSHAVTNAGTFAVQNTAQASTNTQEIVGDAADDAATAGNPVLVAGVAVETDGTDPTTVSAEGDAAYLRTDRARRLLVSQHHPRGFFTSADYASAQTNASVQAAPGAGLSLYITDIVISNGAVAGNITLLDGSGGTVKFELYPAINGGVSISLKQPIRLTANTALCITSTTVTTHSLNIGGYIAP